MNDSSNIREFHQKFGRTLILVDQIVSPSYQNYTKPIGFHCSGILIQSRETKRFACQIKKKQKNRPMQNRKLILLQYHANYFGIEIFSVIGYKNYDTFLILLDTTVKCFGFYVSSDIKIAIFYLSLFENKLHKT